ncbi:hypothetical protein V5O48_011727 [Marasmius crinis-equi]|uniref:Cytochrome P450 n=1 Tax=Marasmius crinis-equi TaxID=585013 RepID=A0ABR3F4R8_9AGAR
MSFTSFNSTSYEFSYSANPQFITGLILISLSAIYITRKLLEQKEGKLPPGPRGLPIIGNLLQLSIDPWIPFTEWKYKFGPLVYLTVGHQGILVINSPKVATELLDRKANVYNNRPRFIGKHVSSASASDTDARGSIVASEYSTGGMLLPLMENNNVWKRMHRAGTKILNRTMSPSFQPAQEQEAVRLVQNILRDTKPKQWDSELQRAGSSVLLSVVYNLPILESSNDSAIHRMREFALRLSRASIPGTYLVEFFPWMRHLPAFICKWKRDSQTWYRRDTEFFKALLAGVKDRIEKGDDRGSFTSHVIRDQERYGLSETEISWLSAAMYAAGAETASSATAMSWFMLAMVAHPEVQKRCQEELDTVIGRFRMPRLSDQDDLPYIQATAREVLRWRPVTPLGVPHQSTEDDWYEGYYIPKNTIVIANIWAMNHDGDIFGPDADLFKPERHLDSDGKLACSPPDIKQGMFICNA